MLIKDRTRSLTPRNCPPAPTARAWAELERSVSAALETYSNVHQGGNNHVQNIGPTFVLTKGKLR